MKKTRRFLAIIMAIVMAFSFAVPVLAYEYENGYDYVPYIIESEENTLPAEETYEVDAKILAEFEYLIIQFGATILEDMIETAEQLHRTIVATEAARVPNGIFWVPQAASDALAAAIRAAEDVLAATNDPTVLATAAIVLSGANLAFLATKQTGTLAVDDSFRQNVELFPELWCSETLRTAPAFQWTGANTHDLVTGNVVVDGNFISRPDRDNDFNIVEEVFIELPIDTDGDGRRDFIRATIRRPIESERYADLRIPAFIETSPYREGTLGLTVADITIPMFATPDTSHFTFADARSLLPRAADWPWDRAEAIYWDVAAQEWRVGAQAPTLDIGVIPAARPAAPGGIVTRGNPVPVGGNGGHTNIGGAFAQYMFVRGYAVIATNSVGNVFADGITSTGGICETLSAIAAIQWLNGNARGFTCQNAIYEVDATTWSNGMAAMSGTSYNGTLPIAAAATGVEGLGVIIPIAAISNWYYYHRGNGTVVYPGRNNAWHAGFPGEEASDLALICFTRRRTDGQALNAIARNIPSYMRFHAPANCPVFGNEGVQLRANADVHWTNMIEAEDIYSGNYNRFWDERNYLATADRFTAGIIVKHCLNDFNVMPRHFDVLYRAVTEHSDAEIRLVLNRGGHTSFMTHDAVFDWAHLWFDYYLFGVDNNALDMPRVQIQSSVTGRYESFDSWPIPGSVYRRYFLNPSDNPNSAAGNFSFDVPRVREFTIQDDWDPARTSWASTGVPPAGAQYVNQAFLNRTHGAGAQTGNRPQFLADWERALFDVNNLDAASDERIVFVTELTENVRVSGTIVASIEAASDVPWGNLTAALVEIRPAERGRTFGTGATGGGAGVNTEIVRNIPAHNGAGAINIVTPTAPVNPSGNNFWIDYKKVTSGHADIQNPNQTDLITVCDFHAVAPGFEGLIRGRTYMEAGHQNFIPNYYFQSIIPTPGEFNTYVFSFEVMDWEFQAGDKLAIMVFTSDYRYTMTPSNPPEVTIRTGPNTFVDIPSITPIPAVGLPLSNDATLSSLVVAGHVIDPAFAPNVLTYNVTVPNNVTSVTVNAVAAHPEATVTITGGANLVVGQNTVTVTAENGTTIQTYTITVTRAAPPQQGGDTGVGAPGGDQPTIPTTGVTIPGADTRDLVVGGTVTLPANVQPANATNRTVTWASSNPDVATVNANGVVTGVSVGTTVITVTTAGGQTAQVTINVVAADIGDDEYDDEDPPLAAPGFVDVPGHWAQGAIEFVYGRGIMLGVSDTHFAPDAVLTRAMMATILWRLEGEPSVAFAPVFSDVPAGRWYSQAIVWASEQDIVKGIGGGLFDPHSNITREQFAAMVHRYAVFIEVDTEVPATHSLAQFTDRAQIGNWALGYVMWANYNELLTGVTATTLQPQGNVTRAQCATVLHRFMIRFIDE